LAGLTHQEQSIVHDLLPGRHQPLSFGGAAFRKPAKDADSKRRVSAKWFGKHRRGGDAILHHRTLNPVVIGDWSTRMELFTGALMLTASTSLQSRRALNLKEPRSANDHSQLSFTAWFRPRAQPSTYLDSATEPVPWPERDGERRPATGGRPLLPSERQAVDRRRSSRG
jgi:hypothetical protein